MSSSTEAQPSCSATDSQPQLQSPPGRGEVVDLARSAGVGIPGGAVLRVQQVANFQEQACACLSRKPQFDSRVDAGVRRVLEFVGVVQIHAAGMVDGDTDQQGLQRTSTEACSVDLP